MTLTAPTRPRIATATAAALILALAPLAFSATEEDDEHPATTKPGVRLQFIPPPMEGTLSMGIYDKAGKLVRTLHREAATDEFTVALNGLVTVWDGKDNAGADAAPGTYFARGFMVGEFDSEGYAYECNDWVETDSAPHIRRINRIAALPDGLRADGEDSEGTAVSVTCDDEGKAAGQAEPAPVASGMPLLYVRDGQVYAWDKEETRIILEGVTNPLDACAGMDGVIWVIDRYADGRGAEVKAYSKAGEFLRRLATNPAEPQPYQVAAARNRQALFLLEASDSEQRVRMLRHVDPADPSASGTTSTWEVVFSKSIVRCDSLDAVKNRLTVPGGKPFVAQDRIRVNLLANPLEQDKPGNADVTIGIDKGGSFLRLVDGLPLAQLTDTPGLKWAAIGRDPANKSLILYQSDGAVVEGFRIGRIANMMAFDCGDFVLGK